MPIKPENKHLYPDNWKTEIRPSILERANNCCEFCGVQNYSFRRKLDHEHIIPPSSKDVNLSLFSKIVLTIAHLDHNPTNNHPDNLKALCQKCHLNYDKEQHMYNSALTRRKKLPTKDMFL